MPDFTTLQYRDTPFGRMNAEQCRWLRENDVLSFDEAGNCSYVTVAAGDSQPWRAATLGAEALELARREESAKAGEDCVIPYQTLVNSFMTGEADFAPYRTAVMAKHGFRVAGKKPKPRPYRQPSLLSA